MRVFVYRNLKKNCYSIKALEGERKGRVIAHAHTLELENVTFKVNLSGRERVRRTGHKTVHAGVVGQLVSTDQIGYDPTKYGENVYYNPYKVEQFTSTLTGQTVNQARIAYLGLTGVFINKE